MVVAVALETVTPECQGDPDVGSGAVAFLLGMWRVIRRSGPLPLLRAGIHLRVTIEFVMIVLQIAALVVMSFFRLGVRNRRQGG